MQLFNNYRRLWAVKIDSYDRAKGIIWVRLGDCPTHIPVHPNGGWWGRCPLDTDTPLNEQGYYVHDESGVASWISTTSFEMDWGLEGAMGSIAEVAANAEGS